MPHLRRRPGGRRAQRPRQAASRGAEVLLLGMAYKKDVDDPRESPGFELMDLLLEKGAVVEYNDPHIPGLPRDAALPPPQAWRASELTARVPRSRDCVLIVTDHSAYDWPGSSRALGLDRRHPQRHPRRGRPRPRPDRPGLSGLERPVPGGPIQSGVRQSRLAVNTTRQSDRSPYWPGTTMLMKEGLRFVPSRVEGLPDVSEVAIYPDRLELQSAGKWVVFRFTDLARWPRPAWLRRLLFRAGWRPRWLPVADRDWFHLPRDRFFAFYTRPPVIVYLTDDDPGVGYDETLFRRIQAVIGAGGFEYLRSGMTPIPPPPCRLANNSTFLRTLMGRTTIDPRAYPPDLAQDGDSGRPAGQPK